MSGRPAETWDYRLVRALVRGGLWFAFGFRTVGAELCPPHGPLIVAANHRSWLDPVVLAAALPRRAVFVGAEELLGRRLTPGFVPWAPLIRVIAPVVRWYGFVPVRRTELDPGAYTGAAFRAALQVLRAGGLLALFPEGGVNRTDLPLAPLRRGVAALSLRSGAAVLPTWIYGTDRALPLGEVVPRPRRVSVRFGPPLHPRGEEEQVLLDRIRAALLDLYAAGPP
ncbi:MAG: lysophospholipid acyltransferase family protein [Armatimonadota bacterium]|nr:1-acyl-sn-glycerol-3-phosphate acyltransferase [Armatimonadota bacterium]MDW8156572.1 lysophospholipid acyltransferase family protein [Armatimonadota bacterium]